MKQMPLRISQRGGIFVRYIGLYISYYTIENLHGFLHFRKTHLHFCGFQDFYGVC